MTKAIINVVEALTHSNASGEHFADSDYRQGEDGSAVAGILAQFQR